MYKEIKINELNINKPEKVQGYINVLQTEVKIPVTIINGIDSGKTILITSGVHGCEYPGIKTAMELAEEVNPKKVHGRIIIFHPINISAFENRSAAVVPEDNKNLLRMFPGNKEGTLSEKIAYVLSNDFITKADYYFDLHGGDVHEDLLPHIYYPGKAEKEVMEESIKIAKAFDVHFYVKSNTINGTYTSAAINSKVPSILIERGGLGICNEEDVAAYKKDMLNVLIELGVLDGKKDEKKLNPKEIVDARYIDAEESGCWICCIKAGESIKKDQKLGEMRDYFGNLISTYYAEFDGIVLYNTTALYAAKGTSLVAYGKI